MPSSRIYLDNSAATALDPRVRACMDSYWSEHYGNAGGLHEEGRVAKAAIESARSAVALVVGCRADEIVFTSGGTEANNLAIIGHFHALRKKGVAPAAMHMITSVLEHSSVRDCYRALEDEGVRTTYVSVNRDGLVDPEEVARACTEQTVLVSIMHVSNEIGTIQPLRAVRNALDQRYPRAGETARPLFHTDASQAPAWLPVKAESLGVDLLTLDAQKVYGPKGSGCLYRARGVELSPVLYGGNQEFGLRPGTPPTPLIVGCATALTFVEEERATYVEKVRMIRDAFLATIRSHHPNVDVNGPEGDSRLANNLNISFPPLDAERIVLELDHHGIAASTRSACLVGDSPGSYVVRALGKGEATARSSVRFSLARTTALPDVEQSAHILCDIVTRLGYN